MNTLFGLLISVLQLKIAILGCAACTQEQKDAFMVTATSIEQTINAKLAEPEVPATSTPIVVVVQQQPAPAPSAPAPVVPEPEPVQAVTFVGTPQVTALPSSSGALITFKWNTTASTTATVSLCPQQWTCVPQGTSTSGYFEMTRPASGVEWIEIRLSDTEFFRAQRPQL